MSSVIMQFGIDATYMEIFHLRDFREKTLRAAMNDLPPLPEGYRADK
jgi:hypothetical protein